MFYSIGLNYCSIYLYCSIQSYWTIVLFIYIVLLFYSIVLDYCSIYLYCSIVLFIYIVLFNRIELLFYLSILFYSIVLDYCSIHVYSIYLSIGLFFCINVINSQNKYVFSLLHNYSQIKFYYVYVVLFMLGPYLKQVSIQFSVTCKHLMFRAVVF